MKTLGSFVAELVVRTCVTVVHVLAFGEFPFEGGVRDLLREGES